MTTEAATEGWTETKDGTKLFYRQWPVHEAKGSILIVHGYAEHSGRYEHVAEFFNGLGLDVYAVDVRGHGNSDGKRGHVDRYGEYLNDVDAAWDVLAAESSPANRFLLGHSNGGLIALYHALHRGGDYKGLIVTSPFLGVANRVPAFKAFVGRLASAVYPSLAIPIGLPPENLSHDVTVCRAYADDPLVFKTATARFFTEAEGAQDELEARAREIELPILVMQAGDDRVADPKKAKPLHDALGSADKTYIEYPGMFHEILNETEKKKVFEDIRKWVTNRM